MQYLIYDTACCAIRWCRRIRFPSPYQHLSFVAVSCSRTRMSASVASGSFYIFFLLRFLFSFCMHGSRNSHAVFRSWFFAVMFQSPGVMPLACINLCSKGAVLACLGQRIILLHVHGRSLSAKSVKCCGHCLAILHFFFFFGQAKMYLFSSKYYDLYYRFGVHSSVYTLHISNCLCIYLV